MAPLAEDATELHEMDADPSSIEALDFMVEYTAALDEAESQILLEFAMHLEEHGAVL